MVQGQEWNAPKGDDQPMVDMNRRNVLTGLGAAAAGSGMVFGSGAFTRVQAERQVTINVDEDSQALVELDDNDSVDAVNSTGSGGAENGEFELNSSFVANGGQGFNVNSTVEIGNTTDGTFSSTVGPAFELRSNAADPIDVKFDLSSVTNATGATDLTLYLGNKTALASDGDSDSILVSPLTTETVQGAFVIETSDGTDNLGGTITVTAGPTDEANLSGDATLDPSS